MIRDIKNLLVGNTFARLVGFVTLMYFARALSKEQLAIFPVFIMLTGVANIIFSFGLFSTLIKQLPSLIRSDRTEATSIMFTASAIIVAGTMIVVAAIVMNSSLLAEMVLDDASRGQTIQIIAIGCIFVALSKVFGQIMWASGRFGITSQLLVIEAILRLFLTVSLFQLYGLEGLVIGLVATQGIKALLSLYYVRDFFYGGTREFYPPLKLIRTSWPYYLESYLMYFRAEGDNWLVSSILGTSTLSLYYVAKTIYTVILTMHAAIDKVIVERFSRSRNEKEALAQKTEEVQAILVQLTVPFIFFSISMLPVGIQLIAGAKYGEALLPAAILLLAALVQFVRIPTARALFVDRPPMTRFVMTLFESVCLILGLVVLIPLWGASGVASSRVFSQVMGGIYTVFILRRTLKVSYPIRQAFLSFVCVVPVTAYVLGKQTPITDPVQDAIRILGLGILWLLVFAISSWLVNRSVFSALGGVLAARAKSPG